MITVRFNTGVSVSYNSANKLEPMANGGTKILQEYPNGKLWLVAMVPAGAACVIEHLAPCRFENPVEGMTAESAVKLLVQGDGLRRATSYWVSRLKELLQNFDRRTNQWKEENR